MGKAGLKAGIIITENLRGAAVVPGPVLRSCGSFIREKNVWQDEVIAIITEANSELRFCNAAVQRNCMSPCVSGYSILTVSTLMGTDRHLRTSGLRGPGRIGIHST